MEVYKLMNFQNVYVHTRMYTNGSIVISRIRMLGRELASE